MKKEEIRKIINENNISYIRMQFTDMLGDIKAVEIPVQKFRHGYYLCGCIRH